MSTGLFKDFIEGLKLNSHRLILYDTTLRDGAQTPGVIFSLMDKINITKRLDDFGFDYIEGGWPSSNQRDMEYFKKIASTETNAKIVSFGMTSKNPKNDKMLNDLLLAKVVTIFGKSWDLHVRDVLKVSLEQNIVMIGESIDYLKSHGVEVIYDAEHFFDGFKSNQDYCIETLKAAKNADCLVLCDTNGGTLPWEVYEITKYIRKKIPHMLGVHCHNDCGFAVMNTLASISAGAVHIQGTINGLGERCGNMDWCEFLPVITLKMKLCSKNIQDLYNLSLYIERVTGFSVAKNKPFVGENAFTHKAGVHVDAVIKNPSAYEHIQPEFLGRKRRFIVSEQIGRAGVVKIASMYGYNLNKNHSVIKKITGMLKTAKGFTNTDIYLLLSKFLDKKQEPFKVLDYKIETKNQGLAKACLTIKADNRIIKEQAHGVGPVHSLDLALRKALSKFYNIDEVRLTNYRVRILNEEKATAANVEVYIEFKNNKETWSTLSISDDIIKASEEALIKGYMFHLTRNNFKPFANI